MPKIVVYLQPGAVSAERQLRLCAEYCAPRDCEIVSVCPPHDPAAAVALVLAGAVVGVLVAYAARSRPGDIRELCLAAGVELRYVREPAVAAAERLDLAAMYRRADGDVALMARLLGESTGEIRRALARLGVRRNVPPPARGHRRGHNRR